MIAILAAVMLGQFKTGDSVYVPGAYVRAWKTLELAVAQYDEPSSSSTLSADRRFLRQFSSTSFDKNTKATIMATRYVADELYVKAKFSAGDDGWWLLGSNLKILDDSARASIGRAEVDEKYRRYCITKPDHAALTVAIGKGLDPLKMTSDEASTLSASQRKSLSGIKARYLKANGSARR